MAPLECKTDVCILMFSEGDAKAPLRRDRPALAIAQSRLAMRRIPVFAALVLVLAAPAAEAGLGKVKYRTVAFMQGRLTVEVPEPFQVMSPGDTRRKYGRGRGRIVYTSPAGKVNVVLNARIGALRGKSLKDYVRAVSKQIKSHRKFLKRWHGSGVRKVNGLKVGYYEFTTRAGESTKYGIYNLMSVFEFAGALHSVSFNYTTDLDSDLRKVARHVQKSIKVAPPPMRGVRQTRPAGKEPAASPHRKTPRRDKR